MKLFLTVLYSIGLVWNLLFISYNANRLPLLQLLWPAILMVACGVNLYLLWRKKQESE